MSECRLGQTHLKIDLISKMRLQTLKYLIVIVFFILVPLCHCQKGKNKKKCKRFDLENGQVKVKSRGRLARLKCKKGYTMIDGDQFLSCVRKQWMGSRPKCIKSGCDTILEIAHGEAFELFRGALMQFTCSPGYALNGSPSLACDGNSWNASIPYCGHRTPQEDVELTCDFEDSGLCNWEIVNSPPNKGWKRGQGGPTMPGSSAPATDHSTGTQLGHFLFADAADMGTAGQLFSPVFTPPTEAPACFVLYYHIRNHATNGILVSFKPDNISIDNTSVVLRGDSGLQGDDGWTMYYFDLNPYIIIEQHFQIILELLPGLGYNSDLAIDDVALAGGSQCIEYELEYEEQQNPPTTFIQKTTTSLIVTEDSEHITSTNQVQETGTYQTKSDDAMDITTIITTIGSKHFIVDGIEGDDSNSGENIHHPFKTIQRCVDELVLQGNPGDQCQIREGRYHEEVYVNGLKGTEAKQFVIKGYLNERPIIDGTVPIQPDHWDFDEDTGICSATIDNDIFALLLDDDLMTSARWPNALWTDKTCFNNSFWGKCDRDSENGYIIDDGVSGLADSGINATGAMGILNIGSFNTYACPILFHEPGSNNFTYNHTMGEVHWTNNHDQYYFEASLQLLDNPEEWFYDMYANKLYFIPPSGICPDPESTSLRGRTIDFGLEMTNSSWTTVSNMIFLASSLNAHSIDKEDSNIDEVTFDSIQFKFHSASHRMLGDTHEPPNKLIVSAYSHQHNDIDIYGRVSVVNCTFEGGEGAIIYMGNNSYMHNNYFGYNEWAGISMHNGGTVNGQGYENEFSQNTLYKNGFSTGLRPGNVETVKYNHIIGQCEGSLQNDGAGIQVQNGPQDGIHISHNWIHTSPKSGMRFDGGGSSLGYNGDVDHNVIWAAGSIMVKGDNHTVLYNTAFDRLDETRCSICVIYKKRDEVIQNNHTITKSNAGSQIDGGKTYIVDGENWPLAGEHENNYSDHDVKNHMVDPDNLDFRPVEGGPLTLGSEIMGAYLPGLQSQTYWIPGRKLYKTSTPVPPSRATVSNSRDVLMFLQAYMADEHHFYFGQDEAFVESADMESVEYQYSLQEGNIFMLPDLKSNNQYFWRIDAQRGADVYRGDVWTFNTIYN